MGFIWVWVLDTYLTSKHVSVSMRVSAALRGVCIICIGVVSVYNQYNCVYYCDTYGLCTYLAGASLRSLRLSRTVCMCMYVYVCMHVCMSCMYVYRRR
jgi:hypothetical protein